MKYLKSSAVISAFLFLLAGCGDDSSSSVPAENELSSSSEVVMLNSSSEEFISSSSEISSAQSSSSVESVESSSSIAAVPPSLKDKVWFVVGDSFSEGAWEGVEEPSIQTGKYAGKLPVYSYLIGNRTDCDVRNVAVSGSTLSVNSGSTKKTAFTHPEGRLYSIDFSEADIITIYYGINDSHSNTPIGTIDDSSPDTFLGAWNVAIPYLREKYPNAKLGIIISNGCDTEEYPAATVQAAEKWGVPYLDLDGGVGCALMLRSSSRNPASSEEKKKVLLEQRVCETNWHPNEYAHQLESTYIEEWLLSLL